jgi:hypothetical protein
MLHPERRANRRIFLGDLTMISVLPHGRAAGSNLAVFANLPLRGK